MISQGKETPKKGISLDLEKKEKGRFASHECEK